MKMVQSFKRVIQNVHQCQQFHIISYNIIIQGKQVIMIECILNNKDEKGLVRQYSQRIYGFNSQLRDDQNFYLQNHKKSTNSLIKINKNKLPKDFFSKNQSQIKLQRKVSLSQEISRKIIFNNNSTYERFNITPNKKNTSNKLEEKMAQNIFKISNFNNLVTNKIYQDKSMHQKITNILPFRKFNKISQNTPYEIPNANKNTNEPNSIRILEPQNNINNQNQQQISTVFNSSKKDKQNKSSNKHTLHSTDQNKNSLFLQETESYQLVTFYKAKSSILPPIKNHSIQIASKG